MKQAFTLHLPFLVFSLLIFTGCSILESSDKIIDPEWNPTFAAPILDTELQLGELLEEVNTGSYLTIDPDGLISVGYEGKAFTLTDFTLIELPDIFIPMWDTVQSIPFPLARIYSFDLRSGKLKYQLESTDSGNFDLIMRIENATKDGEVFSKTISFTAPTSMVDSIALDGYSFSFTDGAIDLYYAVVDPTTGERSKLEEFIYELEEMEYTQLEGNVGQISIDLATDTFEIDFFESATEINARLEDPQISFTVHNSFGIPIEIQLEKFDVISSENELIPLNHQQLKDGLLLNYPTLGEEGVLKSTEIAINKDNSNIVEVLSSKPSSINWEIHALTHPSGDESEIGFLTDSSKIDVDVAVKIPLHGSFGGIDLVNTFDLDLSDVDIVSSADVKLYTTNGFPLEAALQVYFETESGEVIDSLFNGVQTLLTAASVSSEGLVTTSSEEEIEVSISSDRFDRIRAARQARVKTRISSADNGSVPVKILDTYAVRIQMGIIAEK